MENSSNALYIAGVVLVSIVVASLLVFIFSNVGNFAKKMEEDMKVTGTQKYNAQFEKYLGKENLTGYDIVTLINLANNYNDKAQYKALDVKVNNQSYIGKREDELLILVQNTNSQYECTDLPKNENGKVQEIIIKKLK